MDASPKERGRKKITEEDINKLVCEVKKSNKPSAFQTIREHLSFYLRNFALKYKISGCDYDEIEQECLFALRYKAIEDFDGTRGSFKPFAILCIKRHLFSLIKNNNQLKRLPLNRSISLDQERTEGGETLSLMSLVSSNKQSVEDYYSQSESFLFIKEKLYSKLSDLEQHVFDLYLQQLNYDEIVEELCDMLPGRKLSKKTVDNSLQRIRIKAGLLLKNKEVDSELKKFFPKKKYKQLKKAVRATKTVKKTVKKPVTKRKKQKRKVN